MDNLEKLKIDLVGTIELEDEILERFLHKAEALYKVLKFPSEIPKDYELTDIEDEIVVDIANEVISRIGANGQITHIENGIHRTWEGSDISNGLRKRIVPVGGLV